MKDVKPANILMSEESENARLKLSDFGHSRYLNDLSDRGVGVGTKHYKAPEIQDHNPHNELVDVWSFGATLYVILTNTFPFQVEFDTLLQAEKYHGTLQIPKHLSKDCQEFLKGLLRIRPENRLTWQSGEIKKKKGLEQFECEFLRKQIQKKLEEKKEEEWTSAKQKEVDKLNQLLAQKNEQLHSLKQQIIDHRFAFFFFFWY
ncbi:hypothetical protein RFI_21791 [Reticulomyxa filosa]|uniref:Protein kinase domain-containing protein n=1 Tax=Reticulomyxa filosa TaxID=46433 RepID=X6MNJ4_RETFI|nr:hypothetical protein RFI_21791 [Reticulomyxa filosa]|eukprot:ETO15573.1 hypothetical protein RFI_21791 [Reticulomyxa filosa]